MAGWEIWSWNSRLVVQSRMERTLDRKSGASTYKEIGCYKPSPSSSVLTGILLHSVPFLVRGLFYFSSPLNWRPRIHLIGTVKGAGCTVTWWLNCYCRSRKQPDTVSAYLPRFSPIIGLPLLAPCLLLAVMETHWRMSSSSLSGAPSLKC